MQSVQSSAEACEECSRRYHAGFGLQCTSVGVCCAATCGACLWRGGGHVQAHTKAILKVRPNGTCDSQGAASALMPVVLGQQGDWREGGGNKGMLGCSWYKVVQRDGEGLGVLVYCGLHVG